MAQHVNKSYKLVDVGETVYYLPSDFLVNPRVLQGKVTANRNYGKIMCEGNTYEIPLANYHHERAEMVKRGRLVLQRAIVSAKKRVEQLEELEHSFSLGAKKK